jgi:hypothetical protein
MLCKAFSTRQQRSEFKSGEVASTAAGIRAIARLPRLILSFPIQSSSYLQVSSLQWITEVYLLLFTTQLVLLQSTVQFFVQWLSD